MKQTNEGFIVAPVLLRASSALIDLAIIVVVNLAVLSVVGGPGSTTAVVLIMVTTAAYNIGFVSWRSATPGKMTMSIYVAYPDGQGVRPDTAILRFIVLFSANLAIVDPVLVYVFGAIELVNIGLVLFSPMRRGIHDRVAGTIVLAGKPGAPLTMRDIERSSGGRP